MLLLCEPCKVQCYYQHEWNIHLISLEHQQIAKRNLEESCPREIKERTIVAWKFCYQSSLTAKDLIKYFSQFSLIHDIYIHRSVVDESIKACVVVLDSSFVAESFLDQNNLSKEHKATYSLRDRMTWREWNKAIKDPVQGEIIQARHIELCQQLQNCSPEQQLKIFCDKVSLSEEEVEMRRHLMRELEIVIRKKFQHCRLHPFGSYLSGLSSPEGDIDIFVEVGISFENFIGDPVLEVLTRVYNGLRKETEFNNERDREEKRLGKPNNPKKFKNLIKIRATRVPIIRVVHKETNIQADLSFNSQISVYNSLLIKFYVDFDPRVKPLMLLIRYWGHFHNLLGSDKIKTYALTLMVVVYLNQKSILPMVYYLQHFNGVQQKCVDGWNVDFTVDVNGVRNALSGYIEEDVVVNFKTIMDLAKGFFETYGDVNFKETFVCCKNGGTMDKQVLKNESQVLLDVELPWKKVNTLDIESPMCIQDPFVLNFNVTGNVREDLRKKFQALCILTAQTMERWYSGDDFCNDGPNFNLMDIFKEWNQNRIDQIIQNENL